MTHPAEKQRGRKYVGLPEFAQVGERILTEMDFEQERGTVTNLPDERTIRYYIAEGLIQAPSEKQGTASVFGYLHLLQLIAVKKLQAEHLPIRKIRELVDGKAEQELETLLGIGAISAKRGGSEAKKYLESLLTQSKRFDGPPSSPLHTLSASAAAPLPAQAEETMAASWQRVEIEPGLELHIRSDYVGPTTTAKTRSLADRIRATISRFWKEKS